MYLININNNISDIHYLLNNKLDIYLNKIYIISNYELNYLLQTFNIKLNGHSIYSKNIIIQIGNLLEFINILYLNSKNYLKSIINQYGYIFYK